MAKNLKVILIVTVFLCTLLVIGHVFYWKAFFGLMDDYENLKMVKSYQETSGFLVFWKSYVLSDMFSWGMFRPTYPLLIKFLYETAGVNSIFLFCLNAFFISCTYIFTAMALSRLWEFAKASKLFGRELARWEIFLPLLVVFFALPFDFYSFLYPSLQEKLVFLAFAAALWFFTSSRASRLSNTLWTIFAIFVISFGFFQKAQFLIFLPVFLLFQLRQDLKSNRAFYRTFVVLIAGCCWTAFIKWLAGHGQYTSHFGISNVVMNLKEKWATRLILASFCSVVLAFRTRRDDGWLFLIPAVIMLGYLAIFLQWGVSGYLLIASAPGVALFIVLMIHYLAGVFGSEKFRSVSFALLAVAAVGVTIYKSQKELSRFGDVRQVVYSDAAKRIASEHGVLLMPCWEGSDAMRYYFKRFAGLDIDVVYTQDSKDAVKKYPALPVYWLGGDRNFCGVSDEGKQIVFPPLKPGGFRLLRDLRTI